MSSWARLALLVLLAAPPAAAGPVGRAALRAEIAAWNIDIRPDGAGLPPGQGSVTDGEALYAEACAACHGDFGEGLGRYPALSGGQGTLKADRPTKTVGSFWPHLSTLFDYTRRAMPAYQGQSLTDDQVYALTAYILNLNDLVPADFTLTRQNFTTIRLPNADGFRPDDRATAEDPLFRAPPCRQDCRTAPRITARASPDVTPDDAN
ncbi:cytochrome C [Defluviimonas sp. 20V17]|uniref:Sulfur dehydrogenase subunit SoxD n=1 Tax=Allgaiera indica TaxID=765699 RepID=A0A1H2VMD4_9RHOB|nr:cytochrome c [Allgaiera indica]KDB02979.1 cytochrome C [Defluviimonas sp. 20V17]SDW69456.1 sulfur dehydrogenase subunit SoxD [Allgaiera indica]